MVLVVILLGAGGFATYRGLTSGGSGKKPVALPPCPRPTTAQPAAKPKTRVTVDNATLRNGLAAEVAKQLKQRGFRIASIGNTPTTGHGIATIQFSTDTRTAARVLAVEISGTRLVHVAGSGVLQLDVGPRFQALVSKGAERTALVALAPTPTPAPTPTTSPSPTPSPSCRPLPSSKAPGSP